MRLDAFVSYATEDREAAFAVCAALERAGVQCWIAPRDIGPGRNYAEEIVGAIERAPCLVLVLSSGANRSKFVQSEIERAFSKGKAIFPVRVEAVPPARGLELFLGSQQWVDAMGPGSDDALARVAASIRDACRTHAGEEDLTSRLPGVELGAVLAEGAFGPVHRARHRTLDVEVAVKIVRGALAGGAAVERTLTDARLFARLDHPNLVRLLDAGRLGPDAYLVLEMLDGGSLRRVHSARPEDLLSYARQALSALQAIHEAKLLHRNVKRANLMMRKSDGRLKLAEVGLALPSMERLRQTNVWDLPFMAPELYEDPPRYSVASDLFGLGMTLAAVALPEAAFPSTAEAIAAWVRDGARPKLDRTDLDPRVVSLIERCLATRPEDRPASAAEALASLEGGPTTARGMSDSSARIGPWVLGDIVYESANWKCWAATHRTAGAPARLSLLQPNGALGREASNLVLESAARASELEHPGFVEVLDWGEHEAMPYVVAAAQGVSLEALVEAQGPCDEVTALEFFVALAGALEYLHAAGLVYQAVTPGSVAVRADARSVQLGWSMLCAPIGAPFVDESGRVRLAGVPAYVAPEGFSAKGNLNPAMDIWGLGEVLYYALGGKCAYEVEGDTLLDLMRVKALPPQPVREISPDITAPTAALVAKLMAHDPTVRPTAAQARATAEALVRRLARR